jgi:hypothetical protein
MSRSTSRRWLPFVCGISLLGCALPADLTHVEYAFSRYLERYAIHRSDFDGPFREAAIQPDEPRYYYTRQRDGKVVRVYVEVAETGTDSVYVADPQQAWRELVGERILTR